MKRRDFLKTSVVAGVALSLNFEGLQAALSSNTVAVEQAPDLVAVMGGEPAVMLDKALLFFLLMLPGSAPLYCIRPL